MNRNEIRLYLGYYENELTNRLLAFWMPRCLDETNGGYFNCFNNEGSRLVSRDKYTWSQGRFVWAFSKLASMKGQTFNAAQKAEFLRYAKSGRDFLMRHVLLGPNDWRCSFLMDETGAHKYVPGCDRLDMSISTDEFVILGLSKYSEAALDREAYDFARKLYASVCERLKSGNYFSLPYPLSPRYHNHGKPMMKTCILCELIRASEIHDPSAIPEMKEDLEESTGLVLNKFTDSNDLIHEFLTDRDEFFENLFGQHINPGHSLEDVWFQVEAADLLDKPERIDKLERIALNTLKTGWDEKYGGIFHFTNMTGGELKGDPGSARDEAQMPLILGDWGSKLWWVHSEALYTTLLMYRRTGNDAFLDWHRKVADFSYEKFPQPDTEIREWRQILTREGIPQDKVVALPVKDPFHVIRNVALIVELLYEMKEEYGK